MKHIGFICLAAAVSLIMLYCISIPLSSAQSQTQAVALTEEERAYIKEIGTVKMCVDPDWYPYEKIEKNGNYTGIAADLIGLISERTGLKIELVPTKNWDESIAWSKEGKCDILSFLNETEERDKWLVFTEPYFLDPNVLITREEHDYISDLARLSGEKVVLPEGTSIEERIRRDYPNIKIIIVSSEDEAVDYVSGHKADFTVRSQTMAAYTIRKEGLFNLKIAGQIPDYTNKLRIGIRKDQPMLRGILDKGIAALTPEDVQNAINNYISVEIQKGFDYRLFFVIFGIFSVLVTAGLIWNTQLRKLNRKLKDQKLKLVQMSEQLAKSESLYKSIINASPDAIVIFDKDGAIVMASPIAYRLLHYNAAEGELIGKNVECLILEDDHKIMNANRKALFEGNKIATSEYEGVRKDGKTFVMEVNSEAIRDEKGVPYQMVSIVRDITKRRTMEDKLKQSESRLLALTASLEAQNLKLNEKVVIDKLTGIYNRYYLDQRIRETVERSEQDGSSISILIFDLDKFKYVNDTYGHDTGDQVLIAIAKTVKNMTGEKDVFARWGGEEFLLLMDQKDLESAAETAENIRGRIARISHPNAGIVTVSIGVAEYRKGEGIQSWFKRADIELYRAKNEGRDRVCISKP